jgi:putative SOS response-associated peptidase YedK
MCGRYTLYAPKAEVLADLFGLTDVPPLEPRYNITPTQQVPAVRACTDAPGRELVLLRWGLIPSWADDLSIGNRLINARAETVASKPSFRSAFRRRRCLLVADGFYEWAQEDGRKQPYYFRLKDGQPFAFAGLWEEWQRGGESVASCTILTTTANNLLASYHERMPVILPRQDHSPWLDRQLQDPAMLEALLRPYPSGEMAAYPVSARVNNPRNDDPQCLQPQG